MSVWSIEVVNVGGVNSGRLSVKGIVGAAGIPVGPLVAMDKFGKHWNVPRAIVTGFDGTHTKASTDGRISPSD